METATPRNTFQHRPGNSLQLVRQKLAQLHELRRELVAGSPIAQSLSDALQRDVPPAETADILSHAIVCGSTMAAALPGDWSAASAWLMEQAAPWERWILERIDGGADALANASFHELTHLYEHLLRQDQPLRRKRAGVFYTPQPIVRYMLRQIDEQLREEFSLSLGLADDATWGQLRDREPSLKMLRGTGDGDPFVRLFDPAVGTGAFLLDAIDFIHAELIDAWRKKGLDDDAIGDRWNQYVPRHLLPRLWGMELLAAPCFLARLHVALKLAQTGYRFGESGPIEIHLGNTLTGPTPPLLASGGRKPPDSAGSIRGLTRPARRDVAYDIPFTVVLGNPPFSYLSENQGDWITSLVRGGSGHAGYLHAGGQTLGEKKTWLHDDYVKFLRYAQWRIETTGCGIAALVTNHGYLTNATFRIMRQQLLRAFPRISVVDLHGNRKAREVPPDGSRDENVFGLNQGIAIGFFRRPIEEVSPQVQHAELWGSRVAKFERLRVGQVFNLCNNESGQVESLSYVPAAPDFSFVQPEGEIPPEYAAARSLGELMPLHATAPVTARDPFVVAFSRQELRERIEQFADLSIPDEEIRGRYFARTRSPRYTTGDTRSWKLAEARRIIAAESNWESFIQPCQYRPLDWRWIFWHPAMIDWPRAEVTRHLCPSDAPVFGQVPVCKRMRVCETSGEGSSVPSYSHTLAPSHPLALIARRQIPVSEPCTYFWATSALTLDGIIRNDNRGSESLFLCGASFLTCLNDEVTSRIKDAATLTHYAYALFHSPTYRMRYAPALRSGFPRVLLPRNEKLAAEVANIGRQLVALHVRAPEHDEGETGGSQRLLVSVAPRYPQWSNSRIWIRDDYSIAAAKEEVWQFRVGAHQIARKWLACRRGRTLTEADLAWYGIILDTIEQTRRLMSEVDAAIERQGGFPAAFGARAG